MAGTRVLVTLTGDLEAPIKFSLVDEEGAGTSVVMDAIETLAVAAMLHRAACEVTTKLLLLATPQEKPN